MSIYCGVEFHARRRTVAYCDTADGEAQLRELNHEQDDELVLRGSRGC